MENIFKQMVKNNDYKEKKKFFFRFLKDNGIYNAYKKYIFNPETYNLYQKSRCDNWSFDECAKTYGMQHMLSMLINWSNTKEGYTFWYDLNKKYESEYYENDI